MRKRFFALMTAVLMLAALTATGAAADTSDKTYTFEGYSYTLDEKGSAKIVGYDREDKNLVIPMSLEGHPVTGIGPNVFGDKPIETVIIPEGVVSVEKAAFYSCSHLTSVTLPDSLSYVGANPWRFCTSLTTIRVSRSHPYLATIDGVLYSKSERRLICYPLGRNETSFTVPNGIRAIGGQAFGRAASLKSITLPDGLIEIGNLAFVGCTSLTRMDLPDSVQAFDENPWGDCGPGLQLALSPNHPYLKIDNGILYTKEDMRTVCFLDSSGITDVQVPDGIRTIGAYTFYSAVAANITLPDTVETLEANAFYSCDHLRDIVVPASVSAVSDKVFSNAAPQNVIVAPGSLMEEFCRGNRVPYTADESAGGGDWGDSTDWLDDFAEVTPEPAPETTEPASIWDFFK